MAFGIGEGMVIALMLADAALAMQGFRHAEEIDSRFVRADHGGGSSRGFRSGNVIRIQ